MENSKLMTPLFYDGMFNRSDRKMRAVFEKEISDGTQTYRLWRSAGKPDLEYPRAENDKYILYVEINGYLATLGMTDFHLVNHCGFEAMVKSLYVESEERERHFDSLRRSGDDAAIHAALAEEDKEIERCGNSPACQTKYIHSLLNKRVNTYLEARENGGQTFPDFTGALVLNDLARCAQLSVAYRAKRQAGDEAHLARVAEAEKAYCEEQNRVAEQAVSTALQIIRNGGVLKNTAVKFYDSKYSARDYSIVNYLMRKYEVDVPLRTQGWINEKLASATIKDGKCEHLQFFRSKNGRGSQKFFECMDTLIRAVAASEPEQAA